MAKPGALAGDGDGVVLGSRIFHGKPVELYVSLLETDMWLPHTFKYKETRAVYFTNIYREARFRHAHVCMHVYIYISKFILDTYICIYIYV